MLDAVYLDIDRVGLRSARPRGSSSRRIPNGADFETSSARIADFKKLSTPDAR